MSEAEKSTSLSTLVRPPLSRSSSTHLSDETSKDATKSPEVECDEALRKDVAVEEEIEIVKGQPVITNGEFQSSDVRDVFGSSFRMTLPYRV